ncbi:MAG: succinylglutamate desuccinylase/aspartoacylase family protein [Eubacteriales bacterium]|nr:succinylglutamate desuccinylase/aspartoacylase family protein [Eubacteriales bacterium]
MENMMSENWGAYTLGGLTAAPGECVQGDVVIGDGEFRLPAAIIRGGQPGKTALVTAGVHAGEYVGIQAAVELAARLDPKKVRGTVIIVKVVCRYEFENRHGSLCREDGRNLNREFPGKRDGSRFERLAYGVEKELHREADYYIDLHSGDDYEELGAYVYYAGMAEPQVAEASRRMAQQVDVPYMVRSDVGSGGSYNYAAACGVPSILIERGGMGAWTKEEAHSTMRDVRNILCHLGIYDGEKSGRQYYPLEVQEVQYQSASYDGLWYPEKKPGDIFMSGEVLGQVRDYDGKVLETSVAYDDGVILYQTGSLQVLKDGPMVAYGKIRRGPDDRKERVTNYWTKRSESFLEQRRAELRDPIAGRWMEEIRRQLPQGRGLKILDAGCGAGFFTILLSKEGHEVTGVDLTPEMIACARELAQEEGVSCTLSVMDAEHLDFPDEAFDVVISRNLTWTLPEADVAYEEWSRVLKKGGVLINFDANYGAVDFSDTTGLPQRHAHRAIGEELNRECEEIKRQMPISSFKRPAWDLEALGKCGLERFWVDLGVHKRIYKEADEFYNPTPLFLLRGEK